MEIYNFLKDSRDSVNMDEALWCAFIAAYFGRASANPDHQGEVESAGRFLCAFGHKPTWTWMYVSTNRPTFIDQLIAHEKDLETLRFGNHRKYCEKKPQVIPGWLQTLSSGLTTMVEGHIWPLPPHEEVPQNKVLANCIASSLSIVLEEQDVLTF